MKKIMKRFSAVIALALVLTLSLGTVTVFAATDRKSDVKTKMESAVNELAAYYKLQDSSMMTSEAETKAKQVVYNMLPSVIKGKKTDYDGVIAKLANKLELEDSVYNAFVSDLQTVVDNATNSSGVGGYSKEQTQAEIDKFLHATDFKADADAVSQVITDEATEIMTMIISIICYLVLALITALTALDILFITTPALNSFLTDKAIQAGTTDSKGAPKFRLVTEDACRAYEDSHKDGKNPVLLYMKYRAVAICAIVACLVMFLTGNFGIIIKFIVNILSGVFEFFAGLAN